MLTIWTAASRYNDEAGKVLKYKHASTLGQKIFWCKSSYIINTITYIQTVWYLGFNILLRRPKYFKHLTLTKHKDFLHYFNLLKMPNVLFLMPECFLPWVWKNIYLVCSNNSMQHTSAPHRNRSLFSMVLYLLRW